jgi:8-oxo-dGTP diphosphatase
MEAAEYYNSRPRKAISAGVLFFNAKGELLIVRPTYLDRWLWPGGGVEENETPLQAAIRETEEEIGVTPKDLKLAFVQYRPPKPDGQNESIHFIFVAGTVSSDFLDNIKVDGKEITEAKFVPVSMLPELVSAQRANAVNVYVQNRGRDGLYIENDSLMG